MFINCDELDTLLTILHQARRINPRIGIYDSFTKTGNGDVAVTTLPKGQLLIPRQLIDDIEFGGIRIAENRYQQVAESFDTLLAQPPKSWLPHWWGKIKRRQS